MSSFIAKLELEGEVFNILHCRYSFCQSTDASGNPMGATFGGDVELTLKSAGNPVFIDWMFAPDKTKDGAIIFYKRDAMSKMRELKFEKAICIDFREEFDTINNEPMKITLVISTKNMSVAGIPCTHVLRNRAKRLAISQLNYGEHEEKLWSSGLRKAMKTAEIGKTYNSKELIKLGVPESFANRISEFKVKSKTQAIITWGYWSYLGIKAIPGSDIRLYSKTALWTIEDVGGFMKLSSDSMKFTYDKGKVINYFYLSNEENVISYDTNFKKKWTI
ncbi:MAG: hypothetical protein LBP34_08840 [Flavobacteriaceae bacterium]|jgi:hypothetical protein|nr:hypothetical protein [Flavobacteriaceae bacterium]